MYPYLTILGLLCAGAATLAACRPRPAVQEDLSARARRLAQQFIILDGHIDVPYRLDGFYEDISKTTRLGDFDYFRAREGGLNAPFMAIYIPSTYQETGGARDVADKLIDMVEGFATESPDKYAIATSPADVRRHHRDGLISLPMGMENAAAIEKLEDLQYFYDRGIRYITLTHALDNHVSDSSYDSTGTHGGLSAFGEDVVREMNRLGLIIDVSHISDEAFDDVMRLTTDPVLATHSSLRHFTPGWQRNMSDDMIRRTAENGGVVMINFGSAFLSNAYREESNRLRQQAFADLEAEGLDVDTAEGRAFVEQRRKAHPVGTVDDVVAHINRVVELTSIDHVGLGSDYDGVFALPEGLQDVSGYPLLIERLLDAGYADEDIEKILSGNALRVWEEVAR